MAEKNSEKYSPFTLFNDLASFSKTVETEIGSSLDLASVAALHTDFLESSDSYLLINIKEPGAVKPDNMVFLMGQKVYVFSENSPSPAAINMYQDSLDKPNGRGTVVCFLIMDRVVENHKKRLDDFTEQIGIQEQDFDIVKYRQLSLDIERFSDHLERLHDLLLELQERRYSQVVTGYIGFDYRLLIAEVRSLQNRCRNKIENLKGIRQDHEMQDSEELNSRIVKLNDSSSG